MRVAITGGTGFVGPAVVEEMRKAGHDVVILQHETKAPDGVPGDVTDPASLRRAFAGCQAVAHLVAIRRGKPADFERMHAQATRNVLDAAKEAGARRVLLMSANDADVGETPYFRTKREMERMTRESGLDWTIFRPSYVAGSAPGGFDEEFARIVDKAPLLPSFAGGRFEIQPVSRKNVGEAFARALDRPISVGKTYVLVGPERFTWNEYLRRLARLRGKRRPLAYAPRAVILAVSALAGRAFPASPDELRMLMMGSVGDPGPAVRDLGLHLERWEDAVAGLARPG